MRRRNKGPGTLFPTLPFAQEEDSVALRPTATSSEEKRASGPICRTSPCVANSGGPSHKWGLPPFFPPESAWHKGYLSPYSAWGAAA